MSEASSIRVGWLLARTRPFHSLAWGALLVTAIAASFCGVGLFIAPWVVVGLFASQLGWIRGDAGPRRRVSWKAALCVGFALTVILTVSCFVAYVLFGELSMTELRHWHERDEGSSFGALLCAGMMSAGIFLPGMYAPLSLIDGTRTSFVEAIADSAQRVVRADREWFKQLLCLVALWLCPLVVVVLALWSQPFVSLWASLPIVGLLCALFIPVGTGALAHSYVKSTEVLPKDVDEPKVEGGLRVRAVAGFWLVPIFAFWGAAAFLLATPTPLLVMEQEPETLELGRVRASVEALRLEVPDTRLYLRVSRSGVEVLTEDGGGCGALPLVGVGEVGEVRVWSHRVGFRIGVLGSEGELNALVTGAGVRIGDALSQRLRSQELPVLLVIALLALLMLLWGAGSWGSQSPPSRRRASIRLVSVALALAALVFVLRGLGCID